MSPYAIMSVVNENGRFRFNFGGYSSNNARTIPTLSFLKRVLCESNDLYDMDIVDSGQSILFVQYDDYAHSDVRSVAYGKRVDGQGLVNLVPDTYFFESRGFQATRDLVLSRKLLAWGDRVPVVFWRGSPTTRWHRDDGTEITTIDEIPRVRLCEALIRDRRADAGIIGAWGHKFSIDEILAYLDARGLHRPAVKMSHHANYKYQIDIDGVANAWGFFDKLLMGSCILKVASPFKQWFYDYLRPWEHYIPIRQDLGDLEAKIDWCFSHDPEARDIATRGQAFALEHSFELAMRLALSAIRDCFITL